MYHVECKEAGCGNTVFASGICRKHYEKERLEKAAPCSFDGCQKKSYRGMLCITHYRLEQQKKKPICIVPNCGKPQKNFKSGLCDRHYFRAEKHGSLESTRSLDWGAREKHPMYKSWAWHKRKLNGLCEEWAKNFWAYVEAVGIRPEGSTLRKIDKNKPIGPGNWEWKESIPSKNKAFYQTVWRQKNPEKAKSNDLKKLFGITLEDYKAIQTKQNDLCAICHQKETMLGKDGAPVYMAVDHCHATNKIRGLLCAACNKGLGAFKDDTKLLANAIQYLIDTHPTN
jgi:hypothetical protein